ncbi:ATP-binding cassette subfamily G member 4-like [Neocloeon triangulifer]|uniref:ATP-binding cassette subfamily G member 4-like n=1 Tax=Neocloeon triangulifer TaxID=2078957 RepID=UPI00286F111B|nr:ATP-binding cassette subfamily G member 4-like [Neocloeon triangulifer]
MDLQSTTLAIEFRHLTYTVRHKQHYLPCFPKGESASTRTEILHNISGKFNAGELTAILGPSGAGKTSLLKILAGFRTSGVKGEILINGERRGIQHRRLCCLIPQDAALLENLTLRETLHVAAKLKLGSSRKSRALRANAIRETCRILGLEGCMDTQVCCLSGGEQKRLSCAVELLSDPPLMFFDEPTSGLDSFSSSQVLAHLRILARESRRNIVCSIHQPSSKLFQSFDSIYVLSEGHCLIKGSRELMVQNLANMNFYCPQFYNPADYVLEVAAGERGDISALIGKACEALPRIENVSAKETSFMLPNLETDCEKTENDTFLSLGPKAPKHVCTLGQQFLILFSRALLTTFKDLHMAWLRSAAHVIIGVMLGFVFYNIGNDGAKVTGNVGLIFFMMLFLFFSNAMPTVLTFPSEMSVMLREHLNGWYSIKAYYLARSIADIPLQIMCPTIFLLISYYLSNQPMEFHRFAHLWLVGILLTLLAQSLGLFVGAASDVKMGIFLVPVISIPMLLFSGYFVPVADIPVALRWLSHLSVFYYAFEACLTAMYGFERARLECSRDYCHYMSPKKIMIDLNVKEENYASCICALVGYILALRVLLYLTLKLRVILSK